MDELTKKVYDFAKERLDGLTRWDGKEQAKTAEIRSLCNDLRTL